MRKGFTIIEVVFVFLLIFGVTFFVLPRALNTTKQARFISKWSESYSELEYIFFALKAQKDVEIYEEVKKAPTDGSREEIIVNIIKPYLRIKSETKPNGYEQNYMNHKPIEKKDKYAFSKFYMTESGEVVGINWLVPDCKKDISKDVVCGVVAMDLNGVAKPNTWGEDIFGINIYNDRIEPIGKDVDSVIVKNDCSKYGQGVYCSFYYLIGGRFD